jgi:hypothetical protein
MNVIGINWYCEEQIGRVKAVRWPPKERLWWAAKKTLWGVVFLIVVLLITGCGTKAVFEEWFGMTMVMAFADAFSEESSSSTNNTDELLLNMLKRDDNKMRTAIVDVRLRQVKNAWILDTTDSEEMRDAVFGGMMTSLEIMANTFK